MATIKNFEKEGKVKNVKRFWIINAIAMDASPEVIEELKKRKDVKKIIPDYEVRLFPEENVDLSKPFNVTGGAVGIQSRDPEVVWSVKWIEADKVWQWGINGSGVKVAVVDSGIAPHPDLEGKIIAWKDLVNNISYPYDDDGHGTHVAGTIAGTGKLGYKTGVAPGVDLIGVKVFDQYGASFITLLEGFQWSVEQGADIISFSGGALPFDKTEGSSYISTNSVKRHRIYVRQYKYEEAFKPAFIIAYVWPSDESSNLTNLNISLIAPNGSTVYWELIEYPDTEWYYKYMEDKPLNSGYWTLRIQSHNTSTSYNYSLIVVYPSDGTSVLDKTVYNITKYCGIVVVAAAGNEGELGSRTIGSPASGNKTIAVGATGYMNDSIAEFSSRGPVGWGDNETIKPDIVAPGDWVLSTSRDNWYVYMYGTSMATPHVSGVVALMLQANPSLTPEDIVQVLNDTAVELGDPGKDNIYGFGRINASAAVLAVLPDIDVSPTSIDFGNVTVNETREEIIVITNEGMGNLNITNISLGNSSSPIKLGSIPSLPLILEEGESYNLAVIFSPIEEGNYSNTIIIESNDLDEQTVEICLRGSAIRALKPNLKVENITLKTPIYAGEETVINVTIANNGTGNHSQLR